MGRDCEREKGELGREKEKEESKWGWIYDKLEEEERRRDEYS